jgi:sporulation protein YlmC with PRC-barrel domain
MLIPYDRLLQTPVMSLQTGTELARTDKVLIDPRDLTIVAYQLDGPVLDIRPSYLRPLDVRELSNMGLIVDSSDEFVGIDDVIRIKQVHDYQFDLIGLEVIDEKLKKLGKVASYNVDSDSFSVQQIVVKRPLLKSFGESQLLIHRTQIVEVSVSHIKVASGSNTQSSARPVREYSNPFRQTSVQPESADMQDN